MMPATSASRISLVNPRFMAPPCAEVQLRSPHPFRRAREGRYSAMVRRVASFRQQAKAAVPNGDQHACPLVHAVVVVGGHVEDALAADHLALLLQRIAQ